MCSRVRAQSLQHRCLVAPQHVGSSRPRVRTHVPCVDRQTPVHGTTREVQNWLHFNVTLLFICWPYFLKLLGDFHFSEFLKLLSICMPLHKQWYFPPKNTLATCSLIKHCLLHQVQPSLWSFLSHPGLFYPTPSTQPGTVDQPQNFRVAHTLCPLLVHLEQTVAFLFHQALWSPWEQGSCFIHFYGPIPQNGTCFNLDAYKYCMNFEFSYFLHLIYFKFLFKFQAFSYSFYS